MHYNYSVYIPRMDIFVTEEFIKWFFCENKFGEVYRVDFTTINKKPGFLESTEINSNIKMKSAFIYFNILPESIHAYKFIERIEIHDEIWITPDYEPCHTKWHILKTKKTVPETMMNLHQIVHNAAYLEKKFLEQEKKLEHVTSILNQLISKLFSDEIQEHMLNFQTDIDEDCISLNPTTHQKRIETLEQIISNLASDVACVTGTNAVYEYHSLQNDAAAVAAIEEEEETNSTSSSTTHSSMPSLISVKSMDSDSCNSLNERIRNSYDLCGNN